MLALVAVPLEMLLDSGRHIASAATVVFLRVLGALLAGGATAIRHLTNITTNFYDVYISVPLRIEEWLRNMGDDDSSSGPRPGRRNARSHGETRAHGGSMA
jgi:hypothetical protein